MDSFPTKLRLLREEKRITLERVADELAISKSLLWDLEQGRRRVHGDLLRKIAQFFDVSSDYLLGLSKHRARNVIGADPDLVDLMRRVEGLSPRGKDQLTRLLEWVSEVDEREKKLGSSPA
ncbi:MAG: helix-turn-helix transcriptional regulator [Desulfotomaculaceae bacterium]